MEPTDEENGDPLASRDSGERNDRLLRELSTISNDIHDFKNDIHSAISDLKGDLKKTKTQMDFFTRLFHCRLYKKQTQLHVCRNTSGESSEEEVADRD